MTLRPRQRIVPQFRSKAPISLILHLRRQNRKPIILLLDLNPKHLRLHLQQQINKATILLLDLHPRHLRPQRRRHHHTQHHLLLHLLLLIHGPLSRSRAHSTTTASPKPLIRPNNGQPTRDMAHPTQMLITPSTGHLNLSRVEHPVLLSHHLTLQHTRKIRLHAQVTLSSNLRHFQDHVLLSPAVDSKSKVSKSKCRPRRLIQPYILILTRSVSAPVCPKFLLTRTGLCSGIADAGRRGRPGPTTSPAPYAALWF